MRITNRWIAFLAGLLLASSAVAQSAASFPSKPIRVIIPYAPGGSTDAMLAIYAEKLARELGQPFVMDHRGGGDTLVGVTAATKANPDGHTLVAVTSTILINHWLYPDRQYDTVKDVAVISPLTRQSSVLVTNPALPVTNLKEFIAYARANPGKLNMGSAASGTVLHFQRFMNATGTQFTLVNYKGPGPILTDLMAGRVQAYITSTAAVHTFIKAGKLRGLAVGGDKRSPVIPDVPTFAEAGVKDYDATNWNALFAPGKTPRDVIEKMNAQVRKVQAMPDVIEALDKLGLVPYGPMPVSQADELMRTELDRFGKLIKDSGLKANN